MFRKGLSLSSYNFWCIVWNLSKLFYGRINWKNSRGKLKMSDGRCKRLRSGSQKGRDFKRKKLLTDDGAKKRSTLRDGHTFYVDGNCTYKYGDVLCNRYKILCKLGEGTFGTVVKVCDMKTNGYFAIKLIKNSLKYKDAVTMEIKTLQRLAEIDPTSIHNCVQMFQWFSNHNNVCMVFEMLGPSTYDVLEANLYQPYPIHQIKHIAHQLCKAVKFLHDNRLTHTDIKPENVLFVHSDYELVYNRRIKQDIRIMKNTEIRLIDFGNATNDDDYHSILVSTRHYRAPEVVLELGWSHPCDVWSIGCMLFEYYKGDTLFGTRNTKTHLAMMERILGKIPAWMCEKNKYFTKCKLDWNEKSGEGKIVKYTCKPLMKNKNSRRVDHNNLFRLISEMLVYDPTQRIALDKAINHPFFDEFNVQEKPKNARPFLFW